MKDHYSHQMLTLREQEVYESILEGNSTKAIAKKLALGFETVKTHRKNIYRKLNVSTCVELVNLYHRQEIVHNNQ